MSKKVDLEKEYGEAIRALDAESGYLGAFGTSTLRELLKELLEKQDKTIEDKDVTEAIKAIVKHRGEE